MTNKIIFILKIKEEEKVFKDFMIKIQKMKIKKI